MPGKAQSLDNVEIEYLMMMMRLLPGTTESMDDLANEDLTMMKRLILRTGTVIGRS